MFYDIVVLSTIKWHSQQENHGPCLLDSYKLVKKVDIDEMILLDLRILIK